MNRLSHVALGKPIRFTFDGQSMMGHQGDTLASALLANGVRFVARSFKYHRPRGVFAAGSEEPNALVTVMHQGHPEPNTRATVLELYDGLVAKSQNAWPSLKFDAMAVNDRLSEFFAAGFYYKTFMWPAKFWEALYEPAIRRAAGLGALSTQEDPSQYDKGYLHCDVLVVGGGAAGLTAAVQAARQGSRVILCDEQAELGGRLLDELDRTWLAQTLADLQGAGSVRVLTRTTVFGTFDHGVYGAVSRNTEHLANAPVQATKQTLWHITAQRTVLATGALERPIAFANNDRPGIMLAGALQCYALRYGVNPGQRVALFINHQDGLLTARALKAAGVNLVAVIDARTNVQPAPDLPHRVASRVQDTRGRHALRSIQVLNDRDQSEWIECDALGVSGGWNPNIQLTSHQGARPNWSESIHAFVAADNKPKDQAVVGAAAGRYDLGQCVASVNELLGGDWPVPPCETARPDDAHAIFQVPGDGPAFVDFQNDVTVKDVKLSHQEGMISVEHLKRYTTLGMATDQGKTSNIVGLAVMAELTGRSIQDTGTTMFRPPYTPVALGALAGRSRGLDFKPTRYTPSHQAAKARGAEFVEVGNWLRAQWFVQPGETHWRQSVDREAQAVRSGVGVCDVTTLGKIDVQGRDAAEFLNRVYANGFAKLAVGKTRYGLMLREDGIAMDDGTAARLREDHFVVTTTTANAVPVYRHMEFVSQCLTPELDVHLISTTEAWAQFAVAGPNSRELISRVVDLDVSNEAFEFMACAEARLKNGLRARLFRISFSGELAYELAVPARYGNACFEALLEIGQDLGATPYGTEALGVLRIEKGHAAGNELNGTTTALNLGLGRMVSDLKDGIGRVLSKRPELIQDGKRLVGFKPVDPQHSLLGGAHLLEIGAPAKAAHDLGYLTSVCYSPHVGSSIALGYLADAEDRQGQTLRAVSPVDGSDVPVVVCSPHFVDPKGERLRA